MKKLTFIWLLILIAVCGFLGYTIGKYQRVLAVLEEKSVKAGQNKVVAALDVITANYVDTVDVDRLAEGAVGKMLTELDPHSSYIPASDVETANEDLESSFSGIGIQFNNQGDTILVISIISGGPAEKAGLLPFDRIISIDDSVVAGKGIPQNKLIRMLRGPKDSKVTLGIKRGDAADLTPFELTRGDIPQYSIDVSYKVTDDIGYIKIAKFARETYSEFLTALAKLKQNGAKGYIIDLRSNPGGYLETASYIINEFLPEGQLIVYTQGKAHPRHNIYANGKGTCLNVPLVVLIDELSGSASEIFSGAVQDNDRGLVIGRRSYGKGLVQTKFDLADRSELMLTIARYYTPSGRCIQKKYELGKSDEYGMDLYNRQLHGEFHNADSIKMIDSLEFKTIGGRTVYGGGGIMPDIFIPLDTTGYTSYYANLINTNVLYRFALKYSDANNARLKAFADYKQLYEYLQTQPLAEELADFAVDKGIKRRPNLMEESRALIENQLHSYIVRNFFDNDGFYPIAMKDDAALKKGIEVIKNKTWKPEINTEDDI
ncbi:MAG: S41 family peptidase [Tannerella sp.]|jgi:carboxyl-terminal processing protease|nr:S41 family peptidase [Tannerella sp.]